MVVWPLSFPFLGWSSRTICRATDSIHRQCPAHLGEHPLGPLLCCFLPRYFVMTYYDVLKTSSLKTLSLSVILRGSMRLMLIRLRMEPPPRPHPNMKGMSDGYTASSSSSGSRLSTAPSSAPSVREEDWQSYTAYSPPEPAKLTEDELQLYLATLAVNHDSHLEPVVGCTGCIRRNQEEQFFPRYVVMAS